MFPHNLNVIISVHYAVGVSEIGMELFETAIYDYENKPFRICIIAVQMSCFLVILCVQAIMIVLIMQITRI